MRLLFPAKSASSLSSLTDLSGTLASNVFLSCSACWSRFYFSNEICFWRSSAYLVFLSDFDCFSLCFRSWWACNSQLKSWIYTCFCCSWILIFFRCLSTASLIVFTTTLLFRAFEAPISKPGSVLSESWKASFFISCEKRPGTLLRSIFWPTFGWCFA